VADPEFYQISGHPGNKIFNHIVELVRINLLIHPVQFFLDFSLNSMAEQK
jgi:hypothetical protein